MALMLGSLYEALTAANVPADKAQKAAEEVATYDNRMAEIDGRMDRLEGRMALLQWVLGANIAISVAILMRVVFS